LQKEQHRAANRDGQRQSEEQTAIIHYDDAEDGEMTEDRTGHNGECEAGTEPCGRRKQNQNRRNQLGNAGTYPTPGFESDFAKDINGFGRAREFEEERLQENDRRRDAQSPGENGFGFRVGSHKKLLPTFVVGATESLQPNVMASEITERPL